MALCNSLQLHQPDMHIDLDLPFYIPPKYHLPACHKVLTQIPWAATLMLQVITVTSEDVYISSLQPTCMPVAHEDDEALCATYVSAAKLCIQASLWLRNL